MTVTLAISLYCAAWFLLLRSLRSGRAKGRREILIIAAAALVVQAISLYQNIYTPRGIDVSFFRILPLFSWVLALMVLVSSLRKPLHNLFIIILPFCVLTLLAELYFGTQSLTPLNLSTGVATHVVLSIIAYSIMAMATVQALILAFQDAQIKAKHPTGMIRLLPPLQTMETLFFEMLWVGQITLTLSLVSGAFFVENLFAQHLAHKTVLSVLAWLIYGVLLWGRFKRGWRGHLATRWALSGFVFLILAYFGSKFVLELVLERV